MTLAQAVMELVLHRLYEKKENSLTRKLMRKSSLVSGLFEEKITELSEKNKFHSLYRTAI
jgi:hypothetical protein